LKRLERFERLERLKVELGMKSKEKIKMRYLMLCIFLRYNGGYFIWGLRCEV